MAILEFILALVVILVVVTAVPLGVWHTVHTLRRKHRLEAQADAREYQRQLAEDFTKITKDLSEGTSMSYTEYLSPEKVKVKRNELES